MEYLIRKSDMGVFTPFANQTPDHLFFPLLTQAQDMDIKPWISDSAFTDILDLDRESSTDQAKELYAFWRDYVRPYMVNCVFVRMTITHGLNMGTNGFVKFTDRDNTSAEISPAQRGNLKQSYTKNREFMLTRLLQKFDEVDGIFDGKTYTVDFDKYDQKREAPAGINAIGSVNNRDLINNIKFRL